MKTTNKKLLKKALALRDFIVFNAMIAPEEPLAEQEFDLFYLMLSEYGKEFYAPVLAELKPKTKGKTLKALRKMPMVGANLDLKRQRTKSRKVKLK